MPSFHCATGRNLIPTAPQSREVWLRFQGRELPFRARWMGRAGVFFSESKMTARKSLPAFAAHALKQSLHDLEGFAPATRLQRYRIRSIRVQPEPLAGIHVVRGTLRHIDANCSIKGCVYAQVFCPKAGGEHGISILITVGTVTGRAGGSPRTLKAGEHIPSGRCRAGTIGFLCEFRRQNRQKTVVRRTGAGRDRWLWLFVQGGSLCSGHRS